MDRDKSLDEWFPFQGGCAVCGGDDARHRLWDAIVERHNAGDSVALLAEDYDLPVEAIEAVIHNAPLPVN